MVKRLLIILLFSFLIISSMIVPLAAKAAAPPPSPSAAPTWYNSSFQDWYGKVYDPNNPSEIFGERYTAAQVQWVMYGLFSFLINSTSNAKVVQCFLNNVADINACSQVIKDMIAINPDAASSLAEQNSKTQGLWEQVFADRPFSGIAYVREKVQNLSLVPVAHAQAVGFGFTALQPVQDMWAASRDIAFGLFVIIAIVFSFMIMFRVKISPQVVISVQSSIPKIVTALILVTFSYAIAGFAVDLMYVVIGILSFVGTGFMPVHGEAATKVASGIFNFLTVGQPLGANIQVGVFGLLAIYLILLPIAFVVVLFTQIGVIGSSILGALAVLGLGAISPAMPILVIIGVIIIVIIILITVWNMFKVYWALLKAFVNILLLVIFAPIQIAAGVIIPSFSFGSWLKSIFSNLAVFVVTGFLILLSYIFLIEGVYLGVNANVGLGERYARFIFGSGITNVFTSSNAWPPLLGGGQSMAGILFLGVSFVVFTLIPKATEIIQGLVSGKPFAYGTAIGEAFGGVGFAYQQTGANEVVEALRISRRLNTIEKALQKGSTLRPYAEQVVQATTGRGLDESKTILENIVQHKK